MRYGDKDYHKRPMGRRLEEDEIFHLLSEYVKTSSVEKAAKSVNCTMEEAMRVIAEQAKANPAVLANDDILLYFGLTLKEIAVNTIEQAKLKTEKLYGQLALKTAVYAMNRSQQYMEDWQSRQEVAPEGMSSEQIAKTREELAAELDTLKAAEDTGTAPAAGTGGSGSTPEEAVGEDAGSG